MMTDADAAFPGRIGIGDGPMQACRFVSIDMTRDGADTIVTGEFAEGGVIRLDRDAADVPFFFADCIDYQLPLERPALELPDVEVTISINPEWITGFIRALDLAGVRAREVAGAARSAMGGIAGLAAAFGPGEDAQDADWPAESAVCCHVCGPDPGHQCDARATTSITHPPPSGGKRTLPLCDPCHTAETTEVARA